MPSISLNAPAIRARHLLAACAVGAFVLAITPARYTLWLSRLGTGAQVLAGPVQSVFEKLFRPAPVQLTNAEELLHAKEQLDFIKVRYLQLEAENQSLTERIEHLQQGLTTGTTGRVPRVVTPVAGFNSNPSSTLIKIRTDHVKAGADGKGQIGVGSVAVADGVNIVGRVVTPGDFYAWVRPISDTGAGEITAAIYPNEGRTDVPAEQWSMKFGVTLKPQGGSEGLLKGSVLRLEAGTGEGVELPIKPGMKVRLADASWPRFADQLVVGTVQSVTTAPNGRPQVTVKPQFDLRSLREVTILVQPPLGAEPTPPPTKPGGRKP